MIGSSGRTWAETHHQPFRPARAVLRVKSVIERFLARRARRTSWDSRSIAPDEKCLVKGRLVDYGHRFKCSVAHRRAGPKAAKRFSTMSGIGEHNHTRPACTHVRRSVKLASGESIETIRGFGIASG